MTITTVNAVSVLDANYLEAIVETSSSEQDHARIEAVANTAAGLLLEQIQSKKDPNYRPDPENDSSMIAVLKMSQGDMDLNVVQNAFPSKDITVVLSPPNAPNPLHNTLEAQRQTMMSLKQENSEIAAEEKEMSEANRMLKKELEKMNKRIDDSQSRFQKRMDKMESQDKEIKKLQDKIEKLKEEIEKLKDGNEKLKEEIEKLNDGNEKLAQDKKEEAKRYESEFQKLSNEVAKLKKGNDAINRRILLNDAREKAFCRFREANPDVNPLTCPEAELINKLQKLLHSNSHPLSREAVRLFALQSRIRHLGNTAAHEASAYDIGLSVLAMPQGKERKHMSQIYQLVYEHEPAL